jgi:type I restriction enzyme M protein
VLVFRKHLGRREKHKENVFMAIARSCGHDKRGRPLLGADGSPDDDISLVAAAYHRTRALPARLGFYKNESSLQRHYLVPRYYSPEVDDLLRSFTSTTGATLLTVQDLIDKRMLAIGKGHEVGSAAYGTGQIPFIRTSDISNLEISHDPTFGVSEEVYQQYSDKQDLRPLDILFVNDGRYRIGHVCLLTEHDTRIVIQSHLRVIRSLDHDRLDPFLLLFLFRHPVVKSQIESKTFIQSTIATIGPRLRELILPLPIPGGPIQDTIERLRFIVTERARLRREAQQLDGQEGIEI